MTLRAVLLGILLALFVSVFTYYNDHVIHQVLLVGNHFPLAIFGSLLLLVLGVNPLLRRIGVKKVLGGKEIAVILALGLAACGWPGSSFFRYLTPSITLPPNYVASQTAWKAANVLSYVPGASALLGEGHVRDYPAFAKELAKASESSTSTPAGRLWSLLDSSVMPLVKGMALSGVSESGERMLMLNALNTAVANPNLYDPGAFGSLRLPKEASALVTKISSHTASAREVELFNRILLEVSFPKLVLPRPEGHGLFLADGDLSSPVVQGLIQGTGGKRHVLLSQVNWRVWWPTIRFWGGLALCMGIASLCIILVVQPQWKRELLPYPLVRFVDEVTRPGERGGMPAVLTNKLFWIAFGCIFALHLCNALNKWFPTVWFFNIPLVFDFRALEKLLPVARTYGLAWYATTYPTLFPTVVAFAFFLSAEVSFSVGISSYIFLALFSILTRSGIKVENQFLEAANLGMMRFGAFLGIAVVIFFLGRRYYLNVLASSVGLKRNAETPLSAVWAARVGVVCLAGMVIIMSGCGMDWLLGTMLVGLLMLTFFVLTRINVETGVFFVQPMWGPLGVIVSLLGVQAIGPTAYVVTGIICAVLVLDPRECLMPFLANGMYMATDREKKNPPKRLSLLTGALIVVTFAVALLSVVYFQYNRGLDNQDSWAMNSYGPSGMAYTKLPEHISQLSSYNELSQSLSLSGLSRLGALSPDFDMLKWALAGLVLVVVCNMLRLRLSWWPLHPVAFLVLGTVPALRLSISFLLGWIIKVAVVKMAGAKGYRTVVPMMVGVIAAEVSVALVLSIIGAIFFLVTGKAPTLYEIFPS